MILVIDGGGVVACVYDEAIDLTMLGPCGFHRASHLEPDEAGLWWADIHPVGGPKLGPFALRSEALTAERAWLEQRICLATSRSDGRVQAHTHRGTHTKQPKGPTHAQ